MKKSSANTLCVIALSAVLLGCTSTSEKIKQSRNLHMPPDKARELRQQAEDSTKSPAPAMQGRLVATRDRVRAYPVGPTQDPHDKTIVYQSGFIFVTEEEGGAIMLPTSAMLASPETTKPSEVAYNPARLNLELGTELARQRAINEGLQQAQMTMMERSLQLVEEGRKLQDKTEDLEALVRQQKQLIDLLMPRRTNAEGNSNKRNKSSTQEEGNQDGISQ